MKVLYKKGPKTVKRTLCDREYAFHGGTSNLCDYLVHIHSNEFKPKQQPNLDAFVIRGKCPDSRAKRITELIADMVPGIFVQPLWWKVTALKHC